MANGKVELEIRFLATVLSHVYSFLSGFPLMVLLRPNAEEQAPHSTGKLQLS